MWHTRVALVLSLVAVPVAANIWTLDRVPYVPGAVIDPTFPGSPPGFTPADPNRQHLSLAAMPGASPSNRSGVHLFAHGSGGTVPGLNNQEIDKIQAAGYAALSWESITDFNAVAGFTEADKMATCVADLELVLAWLVDNADLYHLDLNDVNMGGRSRGSICSWGAAHTNHPGLNISGIYMYNAIPMNAQTDAVFEDFALQPITASSPPAYLAYGPECPKPINATYCLPTPLVEAGNGQLRPDIHNPRFGQKIVDRYEALGAGDRINISDGMTNANINNIYFYFESFVASLEVNPGPVPPSTPPSAPTPPPSTPTTAQPVCVDNNTGIIALAAAANRTISGCADGPVAQRCQWQTIQHMCCATCAGLGGGNSVSAGPRAAASSGNPFLDDAAASAAGGSTSPAAPAHSGGAGAAGNNNTGTGGPVTLAPGVSSAAHATATAAAASAVFAMLV